MCIGNMGPYGPMVSKGLLALMDLMGLGVGRLGGQSGRRSGPSGRRCGGQARRWSGVQSSRWSGGQGGRRAVGLRHWARPLQTAAPDSCTPHVTKIG